MKCGTNIQQLPSYNTGTKYILDMNSFIKDMEVNRILLITVLPNVIQHHRKYRRIVKLNLNNRDAINNKDKFHFSCLHRQR